MEFVPISIVGLPGAGKTALLNRFAKDGYRVRNEPIQRWTKNGTLAGLYSQIPAQYLAAQHNVLNDMAVYYDSSDNKLCGLTLIERSPWEGVNVFAKLQRDSNLLSEFQFESLEIALATKSNLRKPKLILYINEDPEVCLFRIQNRQRIKEQQVTIEYLQHLQLYYENWLRDWFSEVRIVRVKTATEGLVFLQSYLKSYQLW